MCLNEIKGVFDCSFRSQQILRAVGFKENEITSYRISTHPIRSLPAKFSWARIGKTN